MEYATNTHLENVLETLDQRAMGGAWHDELLVQVDRDAPIGGFIRLSGAADRWHVAVATGDEATLRTTREWVSQFDAASLLRRFVANDPSVGVGGEWRDLDGGCAGSRRWLAGTVVLFVALAVRLMW